MIEKLHLLYENRKIKIQIKKNNELLF